MAYSIVNFQKDFPNDDVCLDYIFRKKYHGKGWYRVAGRKAYANAQGKQVYPLSKTIFEKSDTSLVKWFYAIYLFSVSKNGVSAKELERQLGVTYKCAWRMAYQIRKLMEQGNKKLGGIVEADETYIGGVRRMNSKMRNKTPIIGVVKRGGHVRVQAIKDRTEYAIAPFLKNNLRKGAHLITDEAPGYRAIMNMKKSSVEHGKKEFVRGEFHTNTIEGFWSQLKRSFHGTYHSVSKKHLQAYVNEFAFRYNLRLSERPVFEAILARI